MKDRRVALDLLKIIAALMVIILHVNGYLIDTVSFEKLTFTSSFVWHFSEAFAYPAIHLFVMTTAYLLIEKSNNSIIKSGVNTWLQSFIVCVLGLFLAIVFKLPFNLKEVFSCVFPFIGRAYWYVSDFLVLLFFIPLLNKVVENIELRALKYLITILLFILSFLPTFFSIFNWIQDYSNIGLFVLLYFIVGLIKRHEFSKLKLMGGWQIWFVSIILLFTSWVLLNLLSSKYTFLLGREMILYKYCSPLVIGEAVGVFLVFVRIKSTHRIKLVELLANSSLTVYLIHMHPIIKNNYVSWNIFGWINTSNPIIMIMQLTTVAFCVYFVGILFSIPLNKAATVVSNKIIHYVSLKKLYD